jgi:hypothetical protein
MITFIKKLLLIKYDKPKDKKIEHYGIVINNRFVANKHR